MEGNLCPGGITWVPEGFEKTFEPLIFTPVFDSRGTPTMAWVEPNEDADLIAVFNSRLPA